MSSDPRIVFRTDLSPPVRAVADRLIGIVTGHAEFDVAIKWRQLTFARDSDFDHWVCAIAATGKHARLVFHFGAWLDDPAGAFDPSDAQFVRKLSYRRADEVDEAVVRTLLTQALDALPTFRARRRGPAPPTRRRS